MKNKYKWVKLFYVDSRGAVVGRVTRVMGDDTTMLYAAEVSGDYIIDKFLNEEDAVVAMEEYFDRDEDVCCKSCDEDCCEGENVEPIAEKPIGEQSDGFHTLNELYDHRHALFINLMDLNGCNSWYSMYHEDGTMFPDMFVAGIELPITNGAITYHLPIDLLEMVESTEAHKYMRAPEWDGHSPEEVIKRLYQNLSGVL